MQQPSDLADPAEPRRTFLSSRVRRPEHNPAGVQQALEVVRGWVEALQWHQRAHEKDLETYALLADMDDMRTEASMVAWRLLCVQERLEELEALQNELEHEYLELMAEGETA